MTQGQYTQINFTSKQNHFENERNLKIIIIVSRNIKYLGINLANMCKVHIEPQITAERYKRELK